MGVVVILQVWRGALGFKAKIPKIGSLIKTGRTLGKVMSILVAAHARSERAQGNPGKLAGSIRILAKCVLRLETMGSSTRELDSRSLLVLAPHVFVITASAFPDWKQAHEERGCYRHAYYTEREKGVYLWVCRTCFKRLQAEFGWTVLSEG